jgi:hypothetical protein
MSTPAHIPDIAPATTRTESVASLNQRLADWITLRDLHVVGAPLVVSWPWSRCGPRWSRRSGSRLKRCGSPLRADNVATRSGDDR